MNIKTLTGSLIKEIRDTTARKGLNDRKDIAGLMLTNESMSEHARESAAVAHKGLTEAIQGAIDIVVTNEAAGMTLSPAQRAAATRIAGLAIDPVAGMNAIANGTAPKSGAGAVQISAQDLGVMDVIDGSSLTTESFDGQSLNNAMYFSIAYNLFAARQDAFGETFMPTITIDPTMSGVAVSTEVTSLYHDFSRTTDGATNKSKFNKVTLAKAIYDNNILNADRNKAIPVYRSTDAANAANFVGALSNVDNSAGDPITTAPLVIGKELNLLGISQTDAMLAKGTMDAYDALDRTLNVKSVIISLSQTNTTTNVTTTEHFRVPVGMLPGSNFTYTTQGHNKDLTLGFDTSDIAFLTSSTTTYDGTPSTILAGLPAGHKVKVHLKLNGDANTTYGDIAVYASVVEVADIYDAAGNLLPTTAAAYSTIATEFASMVVDGYEVEAYLTNSNLRTQGQLVTIDRYEQIYNVPVRTGISVVMPINSTNDDDSRLVGQIQTTGYRMSVDTVQALVSFTDNLKVMTSNGADTNVTLMGVGRHHVDAYFSEASLDMATIVDSMSSSERVEDIRFALLARIRDEVYRAYTTSKYNVAHSLLRGNSEGNVGVIIGTSPRIKNYLTTDSDIVDLGSGFVAKVVSTPSSLIGDSIYVTFSDHASGTRNSVVDPISFGQCFWAPTITTDVAATVNGATTRRFQSTPRYLNVVNLPIMIRLNITNLTSVLGKVSSFRHTV